MQQMILEDGRDYKLVPLPQGADPDRIINEEHPGWIYVGDAATIVEAESKIRRERARHRPDSY